MKNTSIILVAILTVFSTSCKEILDEDPRSLIVPDKFFTSQQEIQQAVNGVYSYLNNSGLYNQDHWNNSESNTDLTLPRNDLRYSANFGVGDAYLQWQTLYAAINAANITISGIKQSSVKDNTKNPLLGEATFLRGFYYFLLTTYYGDVPLWTDEIKDVNTTSTLPRSSVEDVYKQIIEDMSYAETVLPVSYTCDIKSRATKGTAEALLARVYLYDKNWQKAKEYAEKVIGSGNYRLLPNYGDIFLEVNERNNEIIFSVEFKTLVVGTWRHSMYTQSKGREGIADFKGYTSLLPSTYLTSLFEPGDLRKDQLVINEWKGIQFKKGPYFGPKFFDLNAPVRDSGKDFYISRYAEVLLILAEAENELNGPTIDAYNAINEVRSRAGLQALSELTQEEFRKALMKERAIELLGEAHRRWDLNRWHKLVEQINAMFSMDGSTYPASSPLVIESYNELYKIPGAEIVKNPNLTQNEGY